MIRLIGQLPIRGKNRGCILLLCALLTGCGDDANTTAGIGGTGITSGEITEFGSVYVNGIKFNTDESQFEVDGEIVGTQTQAQTEGLSVGMIVQIYGNTSTDGNSGIANLVIYDDDIEGLVDNLIVRSDRLTFNIFGQAIVANRSSTSFDQTDFDNLEEDDLVEVSGFRIANGAIQASFIRGKGDLNDNLPDQVEIKGVIKSINDVHIVLDGIFERLTIDITSLVDDDLPDELKAGAFVEIKGEYQDEGEKIFATSIELEDIDFGEDVDEINLQGIVSNYDPDLKTFRIENQQIDASSALLSPQTALISDGINVEVEGSIIGSILVAEEIEIRIRDPE